MKSKLLIISIIFNVALIWHIVSQRVYYKNKEAKLDTAKAFMQKMRTHMHEERKELDSLASLIEHAQKDTNSSAKINNSSLK